MIQSPNCFALPCAGPFHKINAGYVANNNNCELYLPNVWLLLVNIKTFLAVDARLPKPIEGFGRRGPGGAALPEVGLATPPSLAIGPC